MHITTEFARPKDVAADWLIIGLWDSEPLAGRKWLLHTEDAHNLYRRFGFVEPNYKLMERPA